MISRADCVSEFLLMSRLPIDNNNDVMVERPAHPHCCCCERIIFEVCARAFIGCLERVRVLCVRASITNWLRAVDDVVTT